MKWKSKGKTVYVDDPKNSKGWKGIAQTFSESNAELIVGCVNKHKKEEVSGDISVETALEIEQVAEWIVESQDCYDEVEWLLTKMTTKDFYKEYEDILKHLKEREVSVEV